MASLAFEVFQTYSINQQQIQQLIQYQQEVEIYAISNGPKFCGSACGKPNAFVYPITQTPLASLISKPVRLTNEE